MGLSAKDAYKRLAALKQKRQNYDFHWQELADYFLPSKNTITRVIQPGQKRELHLYDSTGVHSAELLAGALHSMLTNPSSYWFEYCSGIPALDRIDSVRKYFQDCSHLTHEVLNGSNFQTEIHEMYIDDITFATAVMAMEEDEDTVVRFMTKHIRDCWIAENNKGFVDTLYYVFKWAPRLILQEFKEKAPAWVSEKAEKSPEEEIELLQAVEPNVDYNPGRKLDSTRKKFSSCVYIKAPGTSGATGEDGVTLEEKGFDTFPYLTPRWAKASGEEYGYGPAMKSLCDVKMINEMMKEHIRAVQKSNNPPLLAPDDGIVGHARLVPGGITYFRSGQGDQIRPLESGQNTKGSQDTMDEVRKRIRDNFYIDQLQLQEGPQMTATEVMQRTEEKIRLLGPLLGRQHSEVLKPLIERLFNIMVKKKLFPTPPPELKLPNGNYREIKVRYRSMLAKAQLQSEAQNLVRVFQAAMPFIQIDPKSAKTVDSVAGIRYVAEMYGLPQELLRTKEVIAQMQQAEDDANKAMLQQQQQQQGVDQVAQMAPVAKIAHEIGGGKTAGPPQGK